VAPPVEVKPEEGGSGAVIGAIIGVLVLAGIVAVVIIIMKKKKAAKQVANKEDEEKAEEEKIALQKDESRAQPEASENHDATMNRDKADNTAMSVVGKPEAAADRSLKNVSNLSLN